MTTYNDFIADLTSENLLDGTRLGFQLDSDDFLFSKFTVPLRIMDSAGQNLHSTAPTPQMKLPDFSFFDRTTAVESISHPTSKLKRKVKKSKRSGKFCQNCEIPVSMFKVRCRFCRERMMNGFFYYSLIFGSIASTLALIFIFMTARGYN